MPKKGSSRKGERRRKSVSAPERTSEDSLLEENHSIPKLRPLPVQEINHEPIKLNVETVGVPLEFAKAIASTPELAKEEPKPLPTPERETEQDWGTAAPTRDVKWMLKALAAAVVLLFVCIGLFNLFYDNADGTTAKDFKLEVIDENFDPRSPLFVFQNDPAKINRESLAIMDKVAKAQSAKEILPLIRQQEGIDALLEKYWKPWPALPQQNTDNFLYSYEESGGRGYFCIEGIRQDDVPFTLFYVMQEDHLVMDWVASMGIGEARLSTLAENPTQNPLMMRVTISPSPYYLEDYPEADYESYKITQPNDEAIVWGYVERGSDAHTKINEILQTGGTLLESLNEARVTIKMKRPPNSLVKNRFFITEMLHKDWVMP